MNLSEFWKSTFDEVSKGRDKFSIAICTDLWDVPEKAIEFFCGLKDFSEFAFDRGFALIIEGRPKSFKAIMRDGLEVECDNRFNNKIQITFKRF